jgi:hypothetical protein
MKRTVVDMLGVIYMSFDGWLALWWVSIPLALFFLVSAAGLVRRRAPLARASVAICLLVPVCAIFFSGMAAFFAADHTSPTAVKDAVLPVRALGSLGVAAVIAAIACIFFARSQRLLATSIALFGGWAVFWIFFVASMSVSGVWL